MPQGDMGTVGTGCCGKKAKYFLALLPSLVSSVLLNIVIPDAGGVAGGAVGWVSAVISSHLTHYSFACGCSAAERKIRHVKSILLFAPAPISAHCI